MRQPREAGQEYVGKSPIRPIAGMDTTEGQVASDTDPENIEEFFDPNTRQRPAGAYTRTLGAQEAIRDHRCAEGCKGIGTSGAGLCMAEVGTKRLDLGMCMPER